MPAIFITTQTLLALPASDVAKIRSLHSTYISGALIHPLLVKIFKTTICTKSAIPKFSITEGVDKFGRPADIDPKITESHCGLQSGPSFQRQKSTSARRVRENY